MSLSYISGLAAKTNGPVNAVAGSIGWRLGKILYSATLRLFEEPAIVHPGGHPGILKIERLSATIQHLINRPYYMLHALLVGVKSSFSLGFLLPG